MGETSELEQFKSKTKQQPGQAVDSLKVIKHLKESIGALHEENAILKTYIQELKGDS
jgi:hypothetical protein